jgi:heme/copper-type cytochrome/quinol oxidase subunit 3
VAITTDPHDQGRVVEAVAGHHETREQRHFKERLAIWIFISGDAVFLLMELFYWFYLRALNTGGMWRGVTCSTAKPCTDGLGNPITHEIAKATPWYTVSIAVLVVIGAALVWGVERSAQRQSKRNAISAGAALGLVAILAAIVVQCYQFGDLRVLHGFDAGPPASARVHCHRVVGQGPTRSLRRRTLVSGADYSHLRGVVGHLHLYFGDCHDCLLLS